LIENRKDDALGYEVRMEVVTPERAKQLLSHNYDGNRVVRESYVQQLAEVMRQDRFIPDNGQTIVVGSDGTLYDGQHRLSAVVLSGKTYVFAIAYVSDAKEKFKTIDNGSMRQAFDFIELPDKKISAAVARVMVAIELGNSSLISCLQGKMTSDYCVDRGLVVRYCNENPQKVLSLVKRARSMRSAVECGSVRAYAAFIGVVEYVEGSQSVIDEFVDDFNNLTTSDVTIASCKKAITKVGMSPRTLDVKWLVGTLLDAYDHYRKHDGSKTLNKQNRKLELYSDAIVSRREWLRGQAT